MNGHDDNAPVEFGNMNQAEILLPGAAPHGFDYRVPGGMMLAPGDLVTVPFGRGESLGVVWGEGKADLPAGKIKAVLRREELPPLSPALRQFIGWVAWYNCALPGAILKMTLPIAEVTKTPRKGAATPHLETAIDIGALHLADLSPAQKKAASELEEKIGKGFSVTLLDGVTGSGKTEVYFDAIAHALKADPQNQILVLLPEIALSVQWLERFKARFGFAPPVWNSEITPARKRVTWQAIAHGEARVVIGARSALFLPYKKLALLILDEEHDQSFKQEDGVIYHARDMAVARARFEKLPAVLVSATPSLESFHNARQGKYAELSLPTRHGGAVLPVIEMLDMRKVSVERGAFISQPLREQLALAIESGHQAMLFLNRRGYAPLMLCRTCGHRFQCPDCSAWLVLHKGKPRLECHHCGYRLAVPKTCPQCATEDNMAACGPGVERLRDEVSEFLPQARVAVMASDHTESYRELEETITAMSEKRIDLLIGTQMIAKGHHFADLAVVGVVDADLGLSGGDLRASERTYQLLHQLSGRAGRERTSGRVYLQSFLPEHPVMRALLAGDRDKFLEAELAARKNAQMPPFTRLAAVIIEGTKEEAVMKTAKQLAAARLPSDSGLQIWGPAPAPLFMLRGKFRYRLLVKADRQVNLPDFVRDWVDSLKTPSSIRVKIDIDPVSFL
jgi:primosomal protein N' (replication factor Y) (superfamily II helicase)